MKNPILITPVKDSLKTAREIINSLRSASHDIPYYIFDDYSSRDTRRWLEENSSKYGYKVIGLERHVENHLPITELH